jgi:hypothetical protein
MFFSNIWSFVRLKITLNFNLLGNIDCLHLGDNCIVFENFTASIGDLMDAN